MAQNRSFNAVEDKIVEFQSLVYERESRLEDLISIRDAMARWGHGLSNIAENSLADQLGQLINRENKLLEQMQDIQKQEEEILTVLRNLNAPAVYGPMPSEEMHLLSKDDPKHYFHKPD